MTVNSENIFSIADSPFLSTFFKNKRNTSNSTYSLIHPQQPLTINKRSFLLLNSENNSNHKYNVSDSSEKESDSSENDFYCTPKSTNSLDVIHHSDPNIPNFNSSNSSCLKSTILSDHPFYIEFPLSVSRSSKSQEKSISKKTNSYLNFFKRNFSLGSLNSVSSANNLKTMLQNRIPTSNSLQQPLLPDENSSAITKDFAEASYGFADFNKGLIDGKSCPTNYSNETSEYYAHKNTPSTRLVFNMKNATSHNIVSAMELNSQVHVPVLNAQHLENGASVTSSINGTLPAGNGEPSLSGVNVTSRLKVRGGFEPHYLEPLHKHRGELSLNEKYHYDLSRAQLKASSRTSALLAGFAMVALVELQYDQSTPRPMLIVLGVVTTLLVSVHLLALMMSTCLLPYIEANGCTQDSPHIKLKFYIELSWLFSTCIGLILFLVEIGVIFFVKFTTVGYNLAAYITTGMLVPVLIIFIVISYLIHRNRFTHSMDRVNDKVVDLQKFINEAEVTPPTSSNSINRNMAITVVKNHR